MPLPLGEGSENWCAAQDSNLQHAALEAAASTNWATRAKNGAPGEIRTRTALVLSEMPPTNWATGAWSSLQASIPPPPTYQVGAVPNELRERIGALTRT